jgi:DNA-binding beta-propeller fold protein YncE
MMLACILLSLSACAKPKPPIFFPAEPAPPRVQLLTSFSNEGDLQNNKALKTILGDDLSARFSKAFGLAFFNGKLFIADAGKQNPGVVIADFTTKKLKRFNNNIGKPMNITVDQDGTIYVCDLSENMVPAIVVFDKQLNYLRRITLDIPNFRPAGALVSGDKLYIADIMNNRIHVIDKNTDELLQTFGEGDGLGWPVDISETPDGNIIVTETGGQSLRTYSPTGEVLARIGKPGDRAGTFSRPKATAVDKDGNIYAVDVAFQNVQILNQEGKALMYFGSLPYSTDSLVMPAGIAISYDRMDIFQPYAAPGFKLEYVIAVSSQGSPNAASKVSIYGFGKKEGVNYSTPKTE